MKAPAAATGPKPFRKPPRSHFAAGGPPRMTRIIAAGGEHVISPEEVHKVGRGDMDHGFNYLDKWVLKSRKKHIKDLKGLKPPKRD